MSIHLQRKSRTMQWKNFKKSQCHPLNYVIFNSIVFTQNVHFETFYVNSKTQLLFLYNFRM